MLHVYDVYDVAACLPDIGRHVFEPVPGPAVRVVVGADEIGSSPAAAVVLV